VTQCLQSAAHLCEHFLQVQQIGFVTSGPYAMRRGGCLELYYCNMVEWFWWDSNLISMTGLIVPEMTYKVLSETLSNPILLLLLLLNSDCSADQCH